MTCNCCQNRSPESRNRVQCQWRTVTKWPLWVPACREKVQTQPLRRHGHLHTHVRHARGRFCSFAKHGCFHTHNAQCTRVLWREHGCAHTHNVLRVYIFLFLMFIHPNTTILVTKGINPSLTESQNFIAIPHKLLELWGNNHKRGWFLTHNIHRRLNQLPQPQQQHCINSASTTTATMH